MAIRLDNVPGGLAALDDLGKHPADEYHAMFDPANGTIKDDAAVRKVAIDVADRQLLATDGTTVVFDFAAQATGWDAPTNVTPLKTFDATTATVGDLANVLATLIVELRARGLLADTPS
jgi:hypothetical protein